MGEEGAVGVRLGVFPPLVSRRFSVEQFAVTLRMPFGVRGGLQWFRWDEEIDGEKNKGYKSVVGDREISGWGKPKKVLMAS